MLKRISFINNTSIAPKSPYRDVSGCQRWLKPGSCHEYAQNMILGYASRLFLGICCFCSGPAWAATGVADFSRLDTIRTQGHADTTSPRLNFKSLAITTPATFNLVMASKLELDAGDVTAEPEAEPLISDNSELGSLHLKPQPTSFIQTPAIYMDAEPLVSGDPELGSLPLKPQPMHFSQALDDPEAGPAIAPELIPDAADTVDAVDAVEAEVTAEQSVIGDPELGTLLLREQPLYRPERPDKVFLVGRLNYFRSDNVFSSVDPIDDQLIRSGVSLLATPRLGPRTVLITSVEGNFIRYIDRTEFNYNELKFQTSLRHRLSRHSFGEIGWANQQLFLEDGGDRFLNDHQVKLKLGRRDTFKRRLTLDSSYELRLSFSNPSDRSRVLNLLRTSLSYKIKPRLKAALDYRFIMANFTQQDRQDAYNQILAQLTYKISRMSQVTFFGGLNFGGSSDPNIDFDGSIVGASFNINFSLF
ncbi:MAG: hypothetical protein F6K19_39175 [Cyanothece sp. SIO1E1]|nr:hypothetical protein [Cyanothece sp. SIO1E1]